MPLSMSSTINNLMEKRMSRLNQNMLVVTTVTLLSAAIASAASMDTSAAEPRRQIEKNTVRQDDADMLIGRLELSWGDPAWGVRVPSKLKSTLVDDAGRRHVLDPEATKKAAGNLTGLSGKRVAVSLAPAHAAMKISGPDQALRPDVIVPVGGDASVRAKVSGTTVWRTIACKFKDITTTPKPLSFFQDQYTMLGNYWNVASYGSVNLTGSSAAGWFTLPQNRSFYVKPNASGVLTADLNKLFDDCVAVANPTVDFGTNGGVTGINMMFNGDLDGYAWGGGRCATLDGVNKCWSTTWNPVWSFNNLAPLAHEMGHGYGLPHANNSDGDGDPYDNTWDNMSDAWSNSAIDPTYGNLPKFISMYSRDALGFITAARKYTVGRAVLTHNIELEGAVTQGSTKYQMVVLPIPGTTTRYYTLEVRRKTGLYDGALAGDAVIIHSVNTGRSEPAWSVDAQQPPADRSNNEGSMFKVGEAWRSPEPAGSGYRVTVVSATTTGFNIRIEVL